jgi:hypothetical protein
MSQQPEKVKVGERLWFGRPWGPGYEPEQAPGGGGEWVTVTKVGRKWFEWGRRGSRADAVTLEPDNTGARGMYGRFYRTQEDWRAEMAEARQRFAADQARAVPIVTRTQKRILNAARRMCHTSSAVVELYDAEGGFIGTCRRRTCDRLCLMDKLTEDQSQLNDEGKGTFRFVTPEEAQAAKETPDGER